MLDIIQSAALVILGYLIYRQEMKVKRYGEIVQEVHIDIKGYEQLKQFEDQLVEQLKTTNKVGTWKK